MQSQSRDRKSFVIETSQLYFFFKYNRDKNEEDFNPERIDAIVYLKEKLNNDKYVYVKKNKVEGDDDVMLQMCLFWIDSVILETKRFQEISSSWNKQDVEIYEYLVNEFETVLSESCRQGVSILILYDEDGTNNKWFLGHIFFDYLKGRTCLNVQERCTYFHPLTNYFPISSDFPVCAFWSILKSLVNKTNNHYGGDKFHKLILNALVLYLSQILLRFHDKPYVEHIRNWEKRNARRPPLPPPLSPLTQLTPPLTQPTPPPPPPPYVNEVFLWTQPFIMTSRNRMPFYLWWDGFTAGHRSFLDRIYCHKMLCNYMQYKYINLQKVRNRGFHVLNTVFRGETDLQGNHFDERDEEEMDETEAGRRRRRSRRRRGMNRSKKQKKEKKEMR